MAGRLDDPQKAGTARAGTEVNVVTLAAWGFVAVLAVLAGFASWQYAPRTQTAARFDGAETTGSIAAPPVATAPAPREAATRVPGADAHLQREFEALRLEVVELRALVGRSDRKSDLLSQRITLLEDQAAILTAGITNLAQRAAAAPAEPQPPVRPAPEPPKGTRSEFAPAPAAPGPAAKAPIIRVCMSAFGFIT